VENVSGIRKKKALTNLKIRERVGWKEKTAKTHATGSYFITLATDECRKPEVILRSETNISLFVALGSPV
jgi:hypothetical protein